MNRILSARRAEIEHGGGMATCACGARVREQRLGEPRLAHAGVGAQQHDGAPALARRTRKQAGEALAFRITTDKGLRVARTRLDAGELPRANAARQAANGDATERLHVRERRSRLRDAFRNHRFAGRRKVGQARGEIDRVAGDRVIAMRGAAGRRRDHLAVRDADVRAERAPGFARQARHGIVDRDGRVERTLDVVAVRDRCAEHAHDRVADVLVDRAAEPRDDAVDEIEENGQQRMRPLGILRAGKARVAREVREQHGHLATLARRECHRRRRDGVIDTRAAVRAEARVRRQLGGALMAVRHDKLEFREALCRR
jgi:hypothetical protein